jgi:hypothetical protein
MAIRTAAGITGHSGQLNTAPSSTLFWTDTLRCVEYILNEKISAEQFNFTIQKQVAKVIEIL